MLLSPLRVFLPINDQQTVLHQELGAPGRKYHRVHQLRVPAEREMAGGAQGSRARRSWG